MPNKSDTDTTCPRILPAGIEFDAPAEGIYPEAFKGICSGCKEHRGLLEEYGKDQFLCTACEEEANRHLERAVHPDCQDEVALTARETIKGEAKYRSTMNDYNRPVRDDTITPFCIGLKLAGYEVELTQLGTTTKLSTCQDCQRPYRMTAKNTHDGFAYHVCPFCNTRKVKTQ